MRNYVGALAQKVSTLTVALVLVFSSVAAGVPLLLSQIANAAESAVVVYDALPATTPATHYPSLGYQATSTSEFGDYIHLGGTNRILDEVTVTLSNWAKYSDIATYGYASNYADNLVSYSHPITLNIYASSLGTNGTPTTLLASKTKSFDIPWVPETNWNYNGIATNITFDLRSLNVPLPDDVIIGVTYNTQTYGHNPIGFAGPYNSLNVAVPNNQTVSVGADDNTDSLFWDSTFSGRTAGFKVDTGWTPNGTVALQVKATADTTPPTITVKDNYTGSLSEKIFSNVSFKLSDEGQVDKYVLNGSTNDLTNNKWSDANFDNIKGKLKQYQLNVLVVYDVAGNSTAYEFTYDPVRPSTSYTSPAHNALVSSSSTITIGYNDDVKTKSAQVQIVGGAYDQTFELNNKSGSFEVPVSALGLTSSGPFKIRTIITDTAGNVSITSDRDYRFDGIAPSVIVTLDKTSPASGTVSVTADLSDEQGLAVGGFGIYKAIHRPTLEASGLPHNNLRENIAGTPWVTNASFNGNGAQTKQYVHQLDTKKLADGAYVLRYAVFDTAGNRGFTLVDLIIDNSKPTVVGSEESYFNPNSLTITATDNEGGTGISTVTGNIYKYNPMTDGYSLLKSNSGSANPLTVDLSTLSDGIYYVRYNARDNALNISNTERFDFVIDTQGAESTIVIPTGVIVGGPAFTISGVATEKIQSATVTINGNTYPALIATDGITWSAEIPNTFINPAGYGISVVLVDIAGNENEKTGLLLVGAAESASTDTPAISQPLPLPTTPTNQPRNTGGTVASAATTSDITGNVSESDGEVLAATTADSEEVNGTVEEGNANSGFNWWWILPILAAFFFIILAVRRRKDKDEA